MSARFKDPFKKSSFNYGLRMLNRLFWGPALKLGSAAVKDLEATASNISKDRRSAQELIAIRQSGLEQCRSTQSIIDQLSKEEGIAFDVRNAMLKFFVAINRYYDKGETCGMDFYSFADGLFSNQIKKVKTYKAKWEYKTAQCLLHLLRDAESYEIIANSTKKMAAYSPSNYESAVSERNITGSCYVFLLRDSNIGYYRIGTSDRLEKKNNTVSEHICVREFPSRAIAESICSALNKTYRERIVRGEWLELTPSDVNDIIQTLK